MSAFPVLFSVVTPMTQATPVVLALGRAAFDTARMDLRPLKHLVGFPDVFCVAAKDDEVFRSVVIPDPVDVMDNFSLAERAAQHFLGHEDVFKDVSPTTHSGSRMVGHSDEPIATTHDSSALPVGGFRATLCSLVCPVAGLATKLPSSTLSAGEGLATLLAGKLVGHRNLYFRCLAERVHARLGLTCVLHKYSAVDVNEGPERILETSHSPARVHREFYRVVGWAE